MRDRTLGHVLEALATDLKERGDLDLSECFIDGTLIAAKRGRLRGEKPIGAKVRPTLPITCPTMRWMFECLECVSVPKLPGPAGLRTLFHGVEPLHDLVIDLLEQAVTTMYKSSD